MKAPHPSRLGTSTGIHSTHVHSAEATRGDSPNHHPAYSVWSENNRRARKDFDQGSDVTWGYFKKMTLVGRGRTEGQK